MNTIIIILIIGAFLAYHRHQNAELERHWKALAADRGLQWQPGGLLSYPQLIGDHRGYAITITITYRS
jgi:hypothetical protein